MLRTALAATVLLVTASVAHAGPLAKTARGVDNKQSSSDRKTSSSTDTNTRDHRSQSEDDDGFLVTGSTQVTCYTCDGQAGELELGPASGGARFAGQDVRDSGGSFRLGAEVLFGQVGAHLSIDHYFENISDKGANGLMEEDVRMNLIDLGPMVRLHNDDVLKLDLRLGFAAATSSHFDSLPGGMVGLRLEALATNNVSLSLEGRAMRYRDDISAYEGVVGAAYDMLWVGYRSLKFDVGPALHGPEAGLRLRF